MISRDKFKKFLELDNKKRACGIRNNPEYYKYWKKEIEKGKSLILSRTLSPRLLFEFIKDENNKLYIVYGRNIIRINKNIGWLCFYSEKLISNIIEIGRKINEIIAKIFK